MPLFPKKLFEDLQRYLHGVRPYEGPCLNCDLYGCTCGMYLTPHYPSSPAAPGSEWRIYKLYGDARRDLSTDHWTWEMPAEWLRDAPTPRKRLVPRLRRVWRRLTFINSSYDPRARRLASLLAARSSRDFVEFFDWRAYPYPRLRLKQLSDRCPWSG